MRSESKLTGILKITAFDKIYREIDASQLGAIISNHKLERNSYLVTVYESIKNVSEKHLRILEVGCGTGIDSLILADKVDSTAFGIDLSLEALRIANRCSDFFNNNLKLINCDGHWMPFRDGAFDLIFSQGVLEHVENETEFISEQIRVLKDGGTIIINVPQKYTAYSLYKHYNIRKGKWKWGYEKEYSYPQLQWYGNYFGLKEKKVIGSRYWLHPLEPAWILRSLFDKIQKVISFTDQKQPSKLKRMYEDLWRRIENKFGHFIMRDIVIVFEKK